ncbi:MAG TPA: HD domain-containing phosphohydrolase [Thermoanaerobaculia bacterium]|jgi:HD-GYP domain-containing protein (c-di-GMP phosphodiesterase class II)|nr:HD domain-containing phosphohydrolase [Thermoanaerobaculia bacterium]
MHDLIIAITSAVNTRTLYPANHPRVVQAVEDTVAAVESAATDRNSDSITFLIVGDDLVAEQDVLRKTTLSHMQFIDVLKRRGIERLTLAVGIDAAEVNQLVSALASAEPIESTPHVIVGKVRVNIESETEKREQREIRIDQIDMIRESFARFRTEHTLPIGMMEQLVWSFIDSLSRTTRFILPLSKLKEHDEYTFVHSVNVSLLVLAQARSFGLQGPMLHSFGMAGLLHDIGKLTVPLTVLNKPGKLEGEEWAIMQGHAEQGSWYLSEMQGALPLTAVVAFEHHLRFDTQPAYPILKTPRVPNLASRLTSIADAYDAMQTVRPYQKPLMRASAMEILKKRAGTFYDPLLVANFAQLIGETPPST